MREVTFSNANNREMAEIRSIQKICKVGDKKALEIYNESLRINPYDLEESPDEPEIFGPEDNYVPQ